jgi:hypothetical protein
MPGQLPHQTGLPAYCTASSCCSLVAEAQTPSLAAALLQFYADALALMYTLQLVLGKPNSQLVAPNLDLVAY